MSEYSAKTLREKMKAKARNLAKPGNYVKDQEVSSADWSPAAPLRTEMKTGARPIMKPSSKGTGESYAARDTKKAIGADMKRGAFKSGGGVKDAGVKNKAALGGIDPSPKRGAAGHYKRGGKAEGGSLLKRMTGAKSEAEKQAESMRDVGKSGTANYTQEDKGALNRALKGDNSLPEPAEAAERSGKYQNYKKGGRTARATGGALDIGSMKKGRHKSGKSGKTDINIVIATGHKPPASEMPMGMSSRAPAAGIPIPPPPAGAPPIAAAPPAMPMGGMPGAPMPGLPGRKSGGRVSKVASTYKDMTAGAASGEGRLQKTDIAKKHHDAPARKAGGRISKVAKSYKDMTAGAGSGEGRLQKKDIAVAKKARRA